MTKLYLNIDGVINVDEVHGWEYHKHGVVMRHTNYPDVIHWSPSMIGALREFDFNITWLTTWTEAGAQEVGTLIGYGSYAPRLFAPAFVGGSSIYWKFAAIEDDYPVGEKFVWIDDQLLPEHIEWASDAGGLAICPDYRYGISPANIDKIRNYLNE